MSVAAPPADGLHPDERRDRVSRWLDRASDWFNPILVKEVRQSLKSRQFVATFMLLLAGAWLVSFLRLTLSGDAIEFGAIGVDVFISYYFVLAMAMFVIVPFTAFRSLLAERDENTFDLLSITTLAPRQIVRGKLLSSFVQLFIFYSAIAPFIAFTSMLKGFDFGLVAYVLAMSLIGSLACCVATLMLSTFARHRHWQALLSVAVLVGLLVLFSTVTTTGMLARFFQFGLPVDDPFFWVGNAIVLAIGLSYCALFLKVTTAQLTFESDNRSTGIRVVTSLQLVLVWICMLSPWWLTALGDLMAGLPLVDGLAPYLTAMRPPRSTLRGDLDGFSTVLLVLCLIHLAAMGLFAATERETLSRRILRGLPRRTWMRVAFAPWLPGCGRGLVYVLLHVAALWWFVLFLAATIEEGNPLVAFAYPLLIVDGSGVGVAVGELVRFATCAGSYVVIYLGIGTLLTPILLESGRDLKPAHARVFTLIIALAGMLLPHALALMELIDDRGYSLWYVGHPILTLDEVADGEGFASVATLTLLTTAALVVLFNARTIVRGFREVIAVDPEDLRAADRERHSKTSAALAEAAP